MPPPGAPSYPPMSNAPPSAPVRRHAGLPRELPPNPAQVGAQARPQSMVSIPYHPPVPPHPTNPFPPSPSLSTMNPMSYPPSQHPHAQRPFTPPQPGYASGPVPPHEATEARKAELAALYHSQLVTYYTFYAMQSQIAPTEGDPYKVRALEEAMAHARRAGVVFAGPPVPGFATGGVGNVQMGPQGVEGRRGYPVGPPVRASTLPTPPTVRPVSLHSTMLPYAPAPQQGAFSPLPPTTSQPPFPSPHGYPPQSVLARSVSSHRPLPQPSPQLTRSVSTHAPYFSPRPFQPPQAPQAPSIPPSPALYGSPNSSGSPASTFSATASPGPPSVHQAAPQPLPQPGPQPPYQRLERSTSTMSISSSFAGSNVSIASNSSTGAAVGRAKRPLPVPPGGRSPHPANGPKVPTPGPSQPGGQQRGLPQPQPRPGPPPAVKSPAELLREKMASLSFAPEPETHDRSMTPTPPLFVVSPVDSLSSRPRSPSISITPVAPSAPVPPPKLAPPARPHPRNDPSHPSHELYHPSSSTPLEAGAVHCARCGETMYGRALMAFGREWHPDCFRCDHEGCGDLLEHIQFDGRDGKVYCMVHYEELYASVCFQCKTPIADEDYLTISDPTLLPSVPTRTYHALHFFCASCGDPFVDPKSLARGREGTLADPYMVHDGYAYCQRCDVRLWKPKCKGCKKGIGGDWVEAVGGVWHPECFSCVDCKRPFTGQYLLRDDGPQGEKAYCVECYEIRAKSDA